MTGERSLSNQLQRFTIYVKVRHLRICREASSPVNLLQPRAPSPALPPPIVPHRHKRNRLMWLFTSLTPAEKWKFLEVRKRGKAESKVRR